MRYRQLGGSGLRVSVLTLGTMTFGGKGVFAKTGETDLAGAQAAGRPLHRGRDQPDRHRRRLLLGRVGGDPRRRSLEGRRDAVLVTTKARMKMGEGPNDAGLSRQHLITRLRGQPEAAGHRLDRPLPAARVGRPDAAGRDAAGAGRPRPRGQGPLCRLLQLYRLAADEGAGRHRAAGPRALRQPADPLHAGGARGRIRAGADRGRPGGRHHGLEPARRRPAQRQIPPRPTASAGFAAPHRLGRAADPRRGPALRHRRGRWWPSPASAAPRRRRWRWPGCWAGRAVARWSSVPAARSSSPPTSPPPSWR